MAIKHKAIKASGDAGLASEWNDDHVVDGDVDFLQFEAVNLVFEGLAAPPAGPIMGQTYFDTVLLQWRVWDGTTWLSYAGVDVSLYIRHNGSVAFTNNQSMGTHKITDVVDPTAAQDAATKKYVDDNDLFKTNGSVITTEGYDIDLLTSATKIGESATNLTAGTYIIFGGINSELYRDGTGTGDAGIKLWLQHGATEINGSFRHHRHTQIPQNQAKSICLETASIYTFNGSEKVSMYAQAVDGCSNSFVHSSSLMWIRIG